MASNDESSLPTLEDSPCENSPEGVCADEENQARCEEASLEEQSQTRNRARNGTDVIGSGHGVSSACPASSQGLESISPNCEELRLDQLPAELILHISSFLHAKVVIHSLRLVCKSLHSLLSDRMFWKLRLARRWPQKYPAIPVNGEEFDWMEACVEREEQYHLWSSSASNMDYFKFTEGLFAAVDAVHLMHHGQLLAAGSRDRYLNVLDLSKLEAGNPESITSTKVLSKMDAHKGWIWSLSSVDNFLASGSWDTYIKFWDLAAEGKEMHRVKLKSAALCTHYEPDFFVAGSYNKRVYHIDPRSAGITAIKHYHSQPVLCLAADDRYIITGSEDKTIAVYDRRAGDIYRKLELPSFAMSLSYGQDQLWAGDKDGSLHLFDATDGDFNLVETYNIGHTGKVTGVIHTPGALFTCSTDKSIKVLHPTGSPDVITTVNVHKAEIASISFQNRILACASSDVSVGVWTPKAEAWSA